MTLEDLKAGVIRDLAEAQAREKAIGLVEVTADAIAKLRLPVGLDVEDGALVLRLWAGRAEIAGTLTEIAEECRVAPVVEGCSNPALTEPEAPVQSAPSADVVPAPAPEPAATGPWTKDEEAKALELAAQGQPVKEIAVVLGRPFQSVNTKLRYLRQKAEPASDGGAAESPAEEAAPAPEPEPEGTAPETGPIALPADAPVALKLVQTHLDKLGYGDGWSPRRDFALYEALSSGRDFPAIAEELGASEDACRRRRAQLRFHPSWDTGSRLLKILAHRAGQALQARG
ncbi:hypothetical protein [Pseudooceanicola sp. 200-1SW]|uniref:hypothetical protein n=1 Tax=Pseudooceanicola sp. 200-1SW TaxID=3425949 RepID=UPI003D7FEF7F